MKLRTTVRKDFGLNPKINFKSRSVFIGSCFAENISDKFSYFKLDNLVNPTGIVYSPISISNTVERLEKDLLFDSSDLLIQDGITKSWNHHSRFYGTDENLFLDEINDQFKQFKNYLSKSDFVFLSLGTAYTYRLKENGRVVANCHKGGNKQFEKFLPDVYEIQKAIDNTVDRIKKMTPEHVQIILTISPVRHLRDGLVENNLSKSSLRLGIQNALSEHNVHYFPSYELIMDDLRDYRFFKEDMSHPSNQAIDYVWEYFVENGIETESSSYFDQIDKLQKSLLHRSHFPESKSHKKFKASLEDKIKELSEHLKITW